MERLWEWGGSQGGTMTQRDVCESQCFPGLPRSYTQSPAWGVQRQSEHWELEFRSMVCKEWLLNDVCGFVCFQLELRGSEVTLMQSLANLRSWFCFIPSIAFIVNLIVKSTATTRSSSLLVDICQLKISFKHPFSDSASGCSLGAGILFFYRFTLL